MKCLSIRQPWAWLVVQGWKNIENREWRTNVRGPILIHAAKAMTFDEYEACVLFVAGFAPALCPQIPSPERLDRGGIVGGAFVLDCVESHPSEWFTGRYGLVLHDAVSIPFIPCRGMPGFFEVDVECEFGKA